MLDCNKLLFISVACLIFAVPVSVKAETDKDPITLVGKPGMVKTTPKAKQGTKPKELPELPKVKVLPTEKATASIEPPPLPPSIKPRSPDMIKNLDIESGHVPEDNVTRDLNKIDLSRVDESSKFVDNIGNLLNYLGKEQQLSEKTKEMLKKIRADFPALRPKQLRPKHNVKIEREKDINTRFTSDEDFKSFKSDAGMEITVKKKDNQMGKLMQQAYDALMTGQTESATSIYKQILDKEPKNKHAKFGLAATYQKAGQQEQAREIYGELLKKDPKNREALNNYLVLVAEEAPTDALTELENLEKFHPEFSPIPAQLGLLYMKNKNYQEAFRALTRATILDPDNLLYRYNLAILMDKTENYREAIKLYRQIIDAGLNGITVPETPKKLQERINHITSKHLVIKE